MKSVLIKLPEPRNASEQIRVYCHTANKDYPKEGIKKGDLYYKWKYPFEDYKRMKTVPCLWNLIHNDTTPKHDPASFNARHHRNIFSGMGEEEKDTHVRHLLNNDPKKFLELLGLDQEGDPLLKPINI